MQTHPEKNEPLNLRKKTADASHLNEMSLNTEYYQVTRQISPNKEQHRANTSVRSTVAAKKMLVLERLTG